MSTNETNFTREQLAYDLANLGVCNGDIVYVHTSMKSIGPIEGGADTLIDSFLDVLGAEGTLAAPSHTLNFVNFRTEPFDIKQTPSYLGVFPEVLRQHPKAIRSMHPTHASVALGAKAEWLTANHNIANLLAYESPLHRIYRENGKILLLGVTHKANTMLHLAESLSGVGYVKLHYNEAWGRAAWYVDANGTVQTADISEFTGCSSGFPLIEGVLKRNRKLNYGKIGNAQCQLMNAKDLVDLAIEILREQPEFFFCQNDRCPCCPPRRTLLGK